MHWVKKMYPNELFIHNSLHIYQRINTINAVPMSLHQIKKEHVILCVFKGKRVTYATVI